MKVDLHTALRKKLAKDGACYVLITCEKPALDGTMQVQMSYEGDTTLVSYLLQGAQDYLDEQESASHFNDDDIFGIGKVAP